MLDMYDTGYFTKLFNQSITLLTILLFEIIDLCHYIYSLEIYGGRTKHGNVHILCIKSYREH